MPDTRRSLSALQTLLADNTSGDISAQDGRDVLVSNHPENHVQTAAFGSIPGSGQLAGDLFLPSDGASVYRYGSAWVPWGPVFPLADPSLQSWAWINQGTGTVATTGGPIHLSDVANASAFDLVIRKKTAPTPPYTITAWILMWGNGGTGKSRNAGLLFRQSSDGKIASHGIWQNDTSHQYVQTKFTNPTTSSADYQSVMGSGIAEGLICLRIADDNSNRICSISRDGINFQTIHSVTRTDFLTADEVGFFVNPWNCDTRMTLLSWKEG